MFAALRRRFQKEQAPAPPQRPLSVLKLEGVNFVFGLDWRLVPPTRRLPRALAMAREEGQSWCAVSELEDVVGFLATRAWLRGPHHSASLHLATRHSQGGLELFALTLGPDRHAVLALQESRPLPGFDFLGDAATARAMVEDFMAIQRGQPIRLVGNAEGLDGLEWVSPEDLFVEPAKGTRLRSLRSWRALRRGLLVLLLLMAAGAGVQTWLEQRRNEMLAQLQTSPAYQQKLYLEGLDQAWASLPPPSAEVVQDWYGMLARLPLQQRGWRLSHVECEIGQCRAHWLRQHGSYADFLAQLPAGADEVDQAAVDQDPLAGKVVTRHSSRTPAAAQPMPELPDLMQARRTLADLFQDLELLGSTRARVEPAQLFGGQQNPQLLTDAVFSGGWQLRHALWVLPTLRLPAFTRVKTLKVHLAGSPSEPVEREGSEEQEPAPKEPFFELTGTYHARK